MKPNRKIKGLWPDDKKTFFHCLFYWANEIVELFGGICGLHRIIENVVRIERSDRFNGATYFLSCMTAVSGRCHSMALKCESVNKINNRAHLLEFFSNSTLPYAGCNQFLFWFAFYQSNTSMNNILLEACLRLFLVSQMHVICISKKQKSGNSTSE